MKRMGRKDYEFIYCSQLRCGMDIVVISVYGSGCGVQRGQVICPRMHSWLSGRATGAGLIRGIPSPTALGCLGSNAHRRLVRPCLRVGAAPDGLPGSPDSQGESDSDLEVVTHA